MSFQLTTTPPTVKSPPMDREKIVTAFKNALDGFDAHYDIESSREGATTISCGFLLESKIPEVMGSFEFRQACIRIFASPIDPLVPKNRTEMLRLVAMANQDMVAGCFEYEMSTDEIRFRFFVDCDGYATLDPDSVRNTLLLPFQMFQRWGDALVAVATGTSDAASAFAAARPDDGEDDCEGDFEDDFEDA